MSSVKSKIISVVLLAGGISGLAFAADKDSSNVVPAFALTINSVTASSSSPQEHRNDGRPVISESTTISAAPSQLVIDFAAGQRNVSGFQLDIQIDSKADMEIDLSDCVSGIPDSHQGFCREIEPGVIRLLVDSPFNGDLDTSNIGVIKVSGGPFEASIVPSSVVAGDSSGKKIETEVL